MWLAVVSVGLTALGAAGCAGAGGGGRAMLDAGPAKFEKDWVGRIIKPGPVEFSEPIGSK
ncbi:MAG: hypothetical protein ACOCZE_02880 [Planctomycetota bacterium]